MKEAEENQKKLQRNNITMIIKSIKLQVPLLLIVVLIFTACELFKQNEEEKIEIPEGVTQQQLQNERYLFKRNKSYNNKFLHQTKTDSAVITIYDIIHYQIKDKESSIGNDAVFYIFDISVDNPTDKPFKIADFTNSCFLSNEDENYHYSNVGMALKMYYLQSDSAQIDMEYTKRFYTQTMPEKEFYRTKLFAFEVSTEDKHPLFLHYQIGAQKFQYQVRKEY
ncbi:MAG: hypothetical protein IT275_01820 [Chitinophagales bacterium]|nr:hypothetical protein [Chitinophagales bacterium]